MRRLCGNGCRKFFNEKDFEIDKKFNKMFIFIYYFFMNEFVLLVEGFCLLRDNENWFG